MNLFSTSKSGSPGTPASKHSQKMGSRIDLFNELLSGPVIDLKELEKHCFQGVPEDNTMKAKCWKVLLGYLPLETDRWQEHLKSQRNLYSFYINLLFQNPDNDENDASDDSRQNKLNDRRYNNHNNNSKLKLDHAFTNNDDTRDRHLSVKYSKTPRVTHSRQHNNNNNNNNSKNNKSQKKENNDSRSPSPGADNNHNNNNNNNNNNNSTNNENDDNKTRDSSEQSSIVSKKSKNWQKHKRVFSEPTTVVSYNEIAPKVEFNADSPLDALFSDEEIDSPKEINKNEIYFQENTPNTVNVKNNKNSRNKKNVNMNELFKDDSDDDMGNSKNNKNGNNGKNGKTKDYLFDSDNDNEIEGSMTDTEIIKTIENENDNENETENETETETNQNMKEKEKEKEKESEKEKEKETESESKNKNENQIGKESSVEISSNTNNEASLNDNKTKQSNDKKKEALQVPVSSNINGESNETPGGTPNNEIENSENSRNMFFDGKDMALAELSEDVVIDYTYENEGKLGRESIDDTDKNKSTNDANDTNGTNGKNNTNGYVDLEFDSIGDQAIDPLSKEPNNPWQTYFQDWEVWNRIEKDINRTHQTFAFFRSNHMIHKRSMSKKYRFPFDTSEFSEILATGPNTPMSHSRQNSPPPPVTAPQSQSSTQEQQQQKQQQQQEQQQQAPKPSMGSIPSEATNTPNSPNSDANSPMSAASPNTPNNEINAITPQSTDKNETDLTDMTSALSLPLNKNENENENDTKDVETNDDDNNNNNNNNNENIWTQERKDKEKKVASNNNSNSNTTTTTTTSSTTTNTNTNKKSTTSDIRNQGVYRVNGRRLSYNRDHIESEMKIEEVDSDDDEKNNLSNIPKLKIAISDSISHTGKNLNQFDGDAVESDNETSQRNAMASKSDSTLNTSKHGKHRKSASSSNIKASSMNPNQKARIERYIMDGKDLGIHGQIMIRILCVYARLNKGVEYVQGMNELLAPIYYVFAIDSSEDAIYAEADAFFCFMNLMSYLADRFIAEADHTQFGILACVNEYDNLLERVDIELWTHFKEQQLDARFYALRWLMLLMAMEFELPEVLRLWDSFLSDENRFEFVTYFAVAMVENVRNELLNGNFATNLQLLQKYPLTDVYEILYPACDLKKDYKIIKDDNQNNGNNGNNMNNNNSSFNPFQRKSRMSRHERKGSRFRRSSKNKIPKDRSLSRNSKNSRSRSTRDIVSATILRSKSPRMDAINSNSNKNKNKNNKNNVNNSKSNKNNNIENSQSANVSANENESDIDNTNSNNNNNKRPQSTGTMLSRIQRGWSSLKLFDTSTNQSQSSQE